MNTIEGNNNNKKKQIKNKHEYITIHVYYSDTLLTLIVTLNSRYDNTKSKINKSQASEIK
jgi:hypothetical protein